MNGVQKFWNYLSIAALFSVGFDVVYAQNASNITFPIVVNAVSYGADPTGILDSTSAINTALSTLVNGVYPTVRLPSGNYLVTNAINLQGGQCLYGSGDHSTFLHITSGFSNSATGVLVLSGAETTSPCTHDLGLNFDVPPGLRTTTSAAQASGTTIQTNAFIPVNYYVNDSTTSSAIPALTSVVSTSGIGPYTLTLSATVTGVLNGDTINGNPNRTSFTTLGSCTTGSGGTGCQYPPALYGVSAGRPRIWNIYVGGAWAGFDFTGGSVANVVPWIDNISMGALTYGIRIDGSQDTVHLNGWHVWEFGLTGNDSNNAYHDNNVYCAQIGRIDGINFHDALCFDSIFQITANASNSETPNKYVGIYLDGEPSQLLVQGGFNNQFVNLNKTGDTNSPPISISAGSTEIVQPDFEVSGSNTFVSITGGTLKIQGGQIVLANGSVAFASQSGGLLDLENIYWNLPATLTTTTISQTSGTIVAKNNVCHSGSSGTFLSVGSDAAGNDIEGNWCSGYSFTLPTGNTNGFYSVPSAYTIKGSSALTETWWRTGNGTNQKGWQEIIGGGTFNLIALSDAGAGTAGSGNTGNVLNISRTGQAITDVGFGNTVDNPTFHFNSTGRVSLGSVSTTAGTLSGGTKFTTSGCSVSATNGGSTAGAITVGANNCNVTVTMGSSATATNGWTCWASDRNTLAINITETSTTTTTAVFNVPVTAGATDTFQFGCMGY